MKKKLIRIVVLVIVFIGAIFLFELGASQVNEDLTAQMTDATLPIVRFSVGGYTIGELHGYTQEMEPSALRDGIICTDDPDTLTVLVENKSTEVSGIRYRIRSLDGAHLLAEDRIERYEDRGGVLTAKLPLPKILTQDTEYILDIALVMEDRTADYYTRLFLSTRCHERECLEFARQFHENTFLEEGAEFLRPYMDPASGSSSTLQFVTLTSTLDQVMWAGFSGTVSGEPSVTYQEINGTFTGLTLSYLLTASNEQGENEYYNVKEFYRLRYTPDRMYVLNFERTMNQIFRQENTFLSSSDNILLGIRDKNVECSATEDGSVVFFAQEGELWGYDLAANTLTDIFTFRGAESIDTRSNYDRHDIRILRVWDNKDLDFAVYGYMNRGVHEGEVALIVYRYSAAMHTIEELLYLPYQISYDMLKEEVNRLLYENENGEIYLLNGDSLLCIDTDSREVTVAAEKLSTDSSCVSYDMRYLAWVPSDQGSAGTQIHFLDLEKGEPFTVDGGEYDYVCPVAFMDGDFIYGAAYAEDLYQDTAGNMVCPYAALVITQIGEEGLQKLKDYVPSGSRIGSVQVEAFTMYLSLVELQDGVYTDVGSDAIVNREAQERQRVEVSTILSGIKQRIVQLTTIKSPGSAKLRVYSADVIEAKEPPLVELPQANRSAICYIYAKGSLLSSADNLSEAIATANAQMGVITDYRQKPLWKRAKKNYVNTFQGLGPAEEDEEGDGLRKCLGAMLLFGGNYQVVGNRLAEGETPEMLLQEAFPQRRIVRLTGLPVDQVLYYLSAGSPVIAMTGASDAILLAGYTATEIYYYDPADGSTHSASYEKINELCTRGGQRYISYVD